MLQVIVIKPIKGITEKGEIYTILDKKVSYRYIEFERNFDRFWEGNVTKTINMINRIFISNTNKIIPYHVIKHCIGNNLLSDYFKHIN